MFTLGQIVATPAALQALEQASITPTSLLARHARGDWGDLNDADKDANTQALVNGSRIFSAYKLPDGVKLWVITEAEGDAGERASTCLLLPDDY